MKSRVRRLLLLALIAAPLATSCLADSITVKGLAYEDVRITGVKGDQIVYIINGNEVRKPLSEVTKIRIDGEPAFNNAEQAFALKDYDKAVDGYQKTLTSTNKAWLKDWASVRLLESANKAGRFDAAVRSYIALAEKNPETAAAIKLNMPAANSAYLGTVIPLLRQAVDVNKANGAAQELLLKLLGEVCKTKGDIKGEEEANEQLVKLQAARDPNSPQALHARVTLALTQARKALDAKEYDRVIEGVMAEAANITDPAEQADALWYLAEARRGKAIAAGAKDAQTWKEIAVAYLRVVANRDTFPRSPHVPEALMRTAEIYATNLNDPATAKAIYKRMIDEDYKGQEIAKAAQKELDKLK